MKKILLLSDNHAGHLLGLTPPEWRRSGGDVREFQKTFWDWFMENLDPDGYDYCLHAGDAVDGGGHKDTTFHLTTDINEQQKIAIATLERVNAKRFIFCTGTPYHTSGALDYEHAIARHFGDPGLSWMRKIEIEGVKINLAHTIGKTSTPVGGDIMLKKAQIWDFTRQVLYDDEAADLIIRGHVHESRFNEIDDRGVVTLPALKLGNPDFDKYARKMSGGFYSVGFREMIIDNGEYMLKRPKLLKFKTRGASYDCI